MTTQRVSRVIAIASLLAVTGSSLLFGGCSLVNRSSDEKADQATVSTSATPTPATTQTSPSTTKPTAATTTTKPSSPASSRSVSPIYREAFLKTVRNYAPALEEVSDQKLISTGLGVCTQLDQGKKFLSVLAYVQESIPVQINTEESGAIAGGAVAAFCTEHIEEVTKI